MLKVLAVLAASVASASAFAPMAGVLPKSTRKYHRKKILKFLPCSCFRGTCIRARLMTSPKSSLGNLNTSQEA